MNATVSLDGIERLDTNAADRHPPSYEQCVKSCLQASAGSLPAKHSPMPSLLCEGHPEGEHCGNAIHILDKATSWRPTKATSHLLPPAPANRCLHTWARFILSGWHRRDQSALAQAMAPFPQGDPAVRTEEGILNGASCSVSLLPRMEPESGMPALQFVEPRLSGSRSSMPLFLHLTSFRLTALSSAGIRAWGASAGVNGLMLRADASQDRCIA